MPWCRAAMSSLEGSKKSRSSLSLFSTGSIEYFGRLHQFDTVFCLWDHTAALTMSRARDYASVGFEETALHLVFRRSLPSPYHVRVRVILLRSSAAHRELERRKGETARDSERIEMSQGGVQSASVSQLDGAHFAHVIFTSRFRERGTVHHAR